MTSISSLSTYEGQQDTPISKRRVNKFLHNWFKLFRRQQKQCDIPKDAIAEQVANRYLQLVFSGSRFDTELSHVLLPWIAELVVKDGFPINESHRIRIIEHMEEVSDAFQDVEKGLFRFSGYDTHRILERIIHDPHKLSCVLRRIHPDQQLAFAETLQSLKNSQLARSTFKPSSFAVHFNWDVCKRKSRSRLYGSSI